MKEAEKKSGRGNLYGYKVKETCILLGAIFAVVDYYNKKWKGE